MLTLWNLCSGEKLLSVELESAFKLLFFGYPYVVVQYSNDPECIGLVNVGANFSMRLFRHRSDVRYATMSPDCSKVTFIVIK